MLHVSDNVQSTLASAFMEHQPVGWVLVMADDNGFFTPMMVFSEPVFPLGSFVFMPVAVEWRCDEPS